MSERGARIKAVIFDSGGTLVHDRGFSRVMCEKISAALKVLAGLETSPDQIEKVVGMLRVAARGRRALGSS